MIIRWQILTHQLIYLLLCCYLNVSSSTLQMLLQLTTRNSQLSSHPASCSPVWSACGRTYTPCHRRACPASWKLWLRGQRTSLIRPTPVTSSVRPSSACASWRARTPSSWYTPGLRRYVGTSRQAFNRCTQSHRNIHKKNIHFHIKPGRGLSCVLVELKKMQNRQKFINK